MDKNKYKLGFIASSIPLVDSACEIADEMNYDLQFSSKGLDEAIPVAKKMENSGVEVIVSRGGTASMLRESLQIPILSIPMTSFDILNSVKKASSLGKKILLPTFRTKLSMLDIFEELFDIELSQGIYSDLDDLDRLILSAQNQGCEVVIGGGVSMKISKKYGLKMVELLTAKETVASVITDAISVARSRRHETEKAKWYQSIIDSTSEGIVAVDQNGIITTINVAALNFLKITDKKVHRKPIAQYIPNPKMLNVLHTQRPMFNRLERINKDQFVASHIPIIVDSKMLGVVSTFYDISNVMRAEKEVRRSFSKGLVAKYYTEDFIYKSKVIKDAINQAAKFAESDSTILITGETGTGKEILAHSIHNLRRNKKGPFVSINCSALPDQLLESELFGYEEGAFTGSRKGGKAGLFEISHDGTIFLDEVGTTSLSVQARLLRVIQEKEVMRIGGDSLIPINVRVVAATNKNMEAEVQRGRLREDLYFRLNVLKIHIPPLRDRIEDIPVLVYGLIKRISEKYDITPLNIPETFIKKLFEYYWPGNVRQLENFLERLILLTDSKFNPKIFNELYQDLYIFPSMDEKNDRKKRTNLKDSLNLKNQEYETEIIRKVLQESNYNKSIAAKKLGISRTSLWRKLKSQNNR